MRSNIRLGAVNRQIVAVLKAPALQDRLTAQGVEIVGDTPEEFARFLRLDMACWAKTVATSGARTD